jgi:hypothetical protein
MSVDHTFNASLVRGGQVVDSCTWTQSQEGGVERDMQIAASQTDVALGVALPTLAKIQSIYIKGDQAFTLETNSGGAPQETLTFVANVPLVWDVRMPGFAIGELFAGAITNMYITTGPITAPLNLKVYITLDVP